MNLALWCSVADACRIANVSRAYMHVLIQSGRIKAQKVGNVYLVSRADVAKFERQPGMGRPKKAKKKARKRPKD
ncbi:MAG: helix-turn-helix domain-containing protein [Planctomycetia bacterium]